jgi:hypothetical protein
VDILPGAGLKPIIIKMFHHDMSLIVFKLFYSVELSASHTLGKHSTTELCHSLQIVF